MRRQRLIVWLCVGAVLTGCDKGNPSSEVAVTENKPSSVASVETSLTWDYSESKNVMAGGVDRFAEIESTNSVNFAFPYSGSQHASLILRQMAGHDGPEVIFSIQRGQLECGIEDCAINVKFDDHASYVFDASVPNDHDSTVLFLEPSKYFIKSLEDAEIVHIQPTVFQNGNPVFTFDVSGFDPSKISFKLPLPEHGKRFAVQASIFSSRDDAIKLCAVLKLEDFHCEAIEDNIGTAKLYKVQIGPANSREEAEFIRAQIKAKTQLPATVVLYQK